jgi:hypothetical protein
MEPQPTVIDGYLHGAGHKYPLSLASPSWKDWLRTHRRFYVTTELGRVSIYKIRNCWIAQKRSKGRLQQRRLGSTARLAGIPWTELAIRVSEVITE